MNELFTLEALRTELSTVLASFGANLSVCNDQGQWMRFMHLYSRVVEDSELVLEKAIPVARPLGLAVSKLTIRSIAKVALEEEVTAVFPMRWLIEYTDGRRGQLELSHLGLTGAVVRIFGPTLESVSALHRVEATSR